MIINVDAKSANYDVVIEQGVLARADKELNLNRKVLVVTDKGVPADYAKIGIIDNGKIVGIGTHDYLLENNEEYKEIYYSQI